MVSRASDEPTIVALGVARARLLTAVQAGRSALFDPVAAMREYRDALADCPVSPGVIATMRAELAARLERGLTVAGGDDLFAELVRRLEACDDLADPPAGRLRLARLEARIAAAMTPA